MVDENGLDIPESNREIALHLRSINYRCRTLEDTVNNRLDNLETKVSNLQRGIEERRFKRQDMLYGTLILPVMGGILLFLLTKALG